jgi:capsular exopolysaccharide synthesis family protein
LLRSRSLAERTAEILNLPDNERYTDPEAPRAVRLSEATDAVLANLNVAPVARSRVINVSFVSPDAREAADVVNALTDGFIQVNLERKYNTTSYARGFLEERIATTKSALESSERRLVEYAQANGILEFGQGGNTLSTSLNVSSLQAFQAALADAERAKIVAEQRFQEARTAVSVSEVVNSQTIREFQIERATVNSERENLLKSFQPNYPGVQQAQARLDALDKEIADENARILASLESEFRAAAATEGRLRDRVATLTGDLQDLRNRSIDYNILQREVDTNRAQYEALLQRYKEIAIAGGVGSSQVAIVDRAVAPLEPFSPSYFRNLALAGVLSLAFAFALATMMEVLDDTVKSPDDVRQKLGEPLIGVVPRTKSIVRIEKLLGDPRSTIAEAFHSMRTSLAFSTSAGTPKSILVTSSRPGEGKTSSVTALAYAFARTGKRVLIIDADMRKPSFAAKPKASMGLSGLLTSDEALADQVINGAIPNVFLLPAGRTPPNPAELLASDRLHRLVADAEAQFDVVILDSAPVLAFADAPILSSVCRASVFVVQSGAVRTDMVQRSVARLREANGMLVGVLLTKLNLKRDGYGYGYGYAYGYGGYGPRLIGHSGAEGRRIHLFAEGDTNGVRDKEP